MLSSADGDGFDAPVVEGLLWGLACLGAVVRARRAPAGGRSTWWLLAAGLALIVGDKAFDLYAAFHDFGLWFAVTVDPEHHLRGPHSIYRDAALGVLFGVGLTVLVWLVRRDRPLGRGKRLCAAGLAVVMLLLVVRMAPPLQPYLTDWLTKGIELTAWLCVAVGLWLGGAAPAAKAKRRIVDGFL